MQKKWDVCFQSWIKPESKLKPKHFKVESNLNPTWNQNISQLVHTWVRIQYKPKFRVENKTLTRVRTLHTYCLHWVESNFVTMSLKHFSTKVLKNFLKSEKSEKSEKRRKKRVKSEKWKNLFTLDRYIYMTRWIDEFDKYQMCYHLWTSTTNLLAPVRHCVVLFTTYPQDLLKTLKTAKGQCVA